MPLEYSSRAARDIRKLPAGDGRRIRAALEQLGSGGAANLDVKALTGKSPFLRMRVGDWRVIYRPQNAAGVWLIVRVVNRRDLDAALKQL